MWSPPTLSTDGLTVFVGSQDNKLHAVDTHTGIARWTYKTGGDVNSSPALSPEGAAVPLRPSMRPPRAIALTARPMNFFSVSGAPHPPVPSQLERAH